MSNLQTTLAEEINNIKKEFNFRESYDLVKALYQMPMHLLKQENNISNLQSIRPSKIKEKLQNALEHLNKGLKLLNEDPQPYVFVTNTQNAAQIHEFVDHQLPDFISIIQGELNIFLTFPGRPEGDIKKHIIGHLLIIYMKGTNKPIKCGWTESKNIGEGDTFKFLCKMKNILPVIDQKLKLPQTDKSICSTVENIRKLINTFPPN